MGGHHDLALLAVDQGEAAQGEAIGPVGLRPVEAGGDRQDAALAHVERQGAGVVPLAHPPGPGDGRPVPPGGPGPLGQVDVRLVVRVHDGGHEEGVAEHVLGVDVPGPAVVGEPQEHRAHDRGAGRVRLARQAVEVGHEGQAQGDEASGDIDGLLVEGPRHAHGARPVEARVRGRQPEGEPALEHGRVRGSLEAADVVAPVAEAAGGQRQPAAQRLPHRGVGGLAVPAPVHGEPLTAGGGGAGEEDGLPSPRRRRRRSKTVRLYRCA